MLFAQNNLFNVVCSYFFVSVILIVLFSAGNHEQSEKKYGFQKNNMKEVRYLSIIGSI
jgi:hypothetical protein